jgi:hypothetical protein
MRTRRRGPGQNCRSIPAASANELVNGKKRINFHHKFWKFQLSRLDPCDNIFAKKLFLLFSLKVKQKEKRHNEGFSEITMDDDRPTD